MLEIVQKGGAIMDEQQNNETRPANPRRRQRSQLQIFKEAYLPAVIACIALLLIIVFIIGSITRGIQRSKQEAQASLEASVSEANELARLNQEASALMRDAAVLAQHFDYESAIHVLDTFSGDMSQFAEISAKRAEYADAMDSMVLWNDPSQVLNLSFQLLIADPARAFTDEIYGESYNRNFVTTGEFSKILQQLYENGYILVSMSDITANGAVKDLYLPNGKKPLILTQTNVNYNTYMIDSDGDELPDKDGDGFASKLVLDANGNIACEMVDSFGQTVTGAYDLVPILDSFIETHPDFSYKGAKAILAVTGYDGLFGYRTSAEAKDFFGTAYHNEQVEGATQILQALRASGYEIACYTYENEAYGTYSASEIQSDLNKWNEEVSPILGTVDILVYARNSDISDSTVIYSGDKYAVLQNFGFTCYLGFCTEGEPWFFAQNEYVRQGRILVTGANMAYNASWFEGIFDAASVLDKSRGTVPS